MSHFNGVSNVDDKSIGDWLNRHPLVVLEDLEPDGAPSPFLQDGESAPIRMRTEAEDEVRPRARRVIVHPHSLDSHTKHVIKEILIQAKSQGYVPQ